VEVVPVAHERDQAERPDHGPRDRQGDVPVETELAASVNPPRLEEVVGYLEHGLAEKEHPEDTHAAGHDQPEERVHQAHAVDQFVEWGEHHLPGYHHGGEHDDHDDPLALELVLGEREAAERGEE